MKQYNKPRRS